MARILIIDDEELARYALRDALQSAGHDVAEAEDGIAGIKLYRAETFDLVITDIIMPEKEGLGTISEILEDNPTQKIIAISGGGRVGYGGHLESASMLGASSTLAKPFSDKELLDCVTACLARIRHEGF